VTERVGGHPVVEVDDLEVAFEVDGRRITAVGGVSFAVSRGTIVGLVGESGSGKSATAAAIAGVLPGTGRVTRGTVRFAGADLLRLAEGDRRRLRGDRIAFLFQEPGAALNPVLTVGAHLEETIRAHRPLPGSEIRALGSRWLERVRMPAAARRYHAYPHELSGGMQQRAALAMALCLDPDLLIADEPTTALDVTVQAQILALFRDVVAEPGRSVLLITHDLGVVAEVADEVLVMLAGRLVERAAVEDLFARPRHPYTRALLKARPPPPDAAGAMPANAPSEPPAAPPLDDPATGCPFRPRCPHAIPRCGDEVPALVPRGRPAQPVACIRAEEIAR